MYQPGSKDDKDEAREEDEKARLLLSAKHTSNILSSGSWDASLESILLVC